MALHSTLPIYKKVYELLRLAVELARNMPRDLKREIGGEIRRECITLTVLILRANVAADKRPHLSALLEHLQVAELMLRLAVDLRLISVTQYSRAIALTDSIGRQANGWKKSYEVSPAA